MPRVGKPTISEFRRRIPVTLDQLESAFYCLATAYDEEDWDAVAKLIERAKRELVNGTDSVPGTVSALVSMGLTGSYSAGRDEINRAFRASGTVNRHFEHNTFGRRHDQVLYNLTIVAHAIGEDLYLLDISDRHSTVNDPEKVIAGALGIERALTGIQVTFPLDVVNGTQFRFDYDPYMDVLRRLGYDKIRYADTSGMTGNDATAYLSRFTNRASDTSNPNPSFYFEGNKHPGLELSMTAYGCDFVDYDTWKQARTIRYTQDGTVITGPLLTEYGDASKHQKPTMVFYITQPPRRDGDPVWPALATTELMAPMRELATNLVIEIER